MVPSGVSKIHTEEVGDKIIMSHSQNRGGLSGRLASHFALSGAAAIGMAAASATAEIIYYTPNWTIPANIDGLYINVETQQTGTAGAGVPGWDLNPYGSTAITFFSPSSPTGGHVLRFPGVTTGSAGNLALNTAVAAGGSYGSGTVTFGVAAGNWVLNSDNYFGFRFTGSSGQTHYGWGKMVVGATAATRTIAEIAFESVPGTPILVGNTGGPPPAYDPCATFNPFLSIGANSVNMNLDTAGNLTLSGCGGTAFKANYFKFTPPASGTYTFDTCTSGASTRMAIMAGCEPGSAQIACNDNSCGTSSSVSASLTSGVSYYIVVGGDSAGSTLPSPISVTVGAPPNPACTDAGSASYGDNAISSTVNPGTSQVVFTNAAQNTTAVIYNAQWFKFTPSATGAFTFKSCSSGDTKIAIATACPAVSQTLGTIAYNDDAPTCPTGGTATSNFGSWIDGTCNGATFGCYGLAQDLVAGTTYYVIVGGYGATTVVDGNLNIDGPQGNSCPADIDGDGIVGGLDLSALLAAWQQSASGDVDGDGDTDGQDLTALLAAWGSNGC